MKVGGQVAPKKNDKGTAPERTERNGTGTEAGAPVAEVDGVSSVYRAGEIAAPSKAEQKRSTTRTERNKTERNGTEPKEKRRTCCAKSQR